MALLQARYRRLSQSYPRDAPQMLPGVGPQNAGSVPFVRRLQPAQLAPPTTTASDSDQDHRVYTYDELQEDEIRLLNLQPGHHADELNASLEIYHLSVADLETREDGEKVKRKLLQEKKLPRPEYEALSYYWGSKAENRYQFPIIILKENKPFRKFLRPNLDAALRHLRLETEERYLWVDALCLNQSDDADGHKEKRVQIPRMNLIYNKAETVCIWLGPKDDTSDLAMDFVKEMLDLHTFDKVFQDAGNVDLIDTFAHLLRREWFGRRWVVQELAVARAAKVYCGSKYVPWEDFAGALALFSSRHVDLKRIFKESKAHDFDADHLGNVAELGAFRLVHAANEFFRKSDDGEILEHLVSLEEVVSTLTMFDAGDPRDIIYAVLSLSRNATASAKNKSAFEIDEDLMEEYFRKSVPNSPDMSTREEFSQQSIYKRISSEWRVREAFAKAAKLLRGKRQPNKIITIRYDAPVFEVYKDFLEHTILHSRSIDIICRPWAAEVGLLPSWITGKSKAIFGVRDSKAFSRVNADLLVGSASPEDKNYSASQDSKATWDYRDNFVLKRSLVVQGFVLDTIDRKLNPALGGIIPEEWYKVWDQNREKTRQPSSAFWRTLAADRGLIGQKPPPAYYELACDYAFKNRVNEGYLDTRDMMKYCPSIVKEFLERVQAVTWMRRLILTRDPAHSRLGLVPYETKKKDLICILQGCSVPVVLRRHDTEVLIKEELSSLGPVLSINVQSPSENGELDDLTDSTESSSVDRMPGIPASGTLADMELNQEERRKKLEEALEDFQNHITTRGFGFHLTQKTVIPEEEKKSQESPPKSPSETIQAPELMFGLPGTVSSLLPSSPTATKIEATECGSKPTLNTTAIPEPQRMRKDDRVFSWKDQILPRYYYELIGECYIHGMMDGEAMRFSDRTDIATTQREEFDPKQGRRQVFWLR